MIRTLDLHRKLVLCGKIVIYMYLFFCFVFFFRNKATLFLVPELPALGQRKLLIIELNYSGLHYPVAQGNLPDDWREANVFPIF